MTDRTTFEEFEILVARHGTDPALWPEPDLARDPEVAGWLLAERAFEAKLHGTAMPPLSANFGDRVVGALPAQRRWRIPGAVAATVLVAIVGVALVGGPMRNGPAQGESAEPWLEFAEDAEFGDLYEWVMDG